MISRRREFGREGEESSERRRLPMVSSAPRRISCAYIGRSSSRTLYASLAFLGEKKEEEEQGTPREKILV